MKTRLDCPNAARDTASGLPDTNTEGTAMRVVPEGAEKISLQTDHPPLRVAHKCLRDKCIRWQENRCTAAKKMLDALEQKELTPHLHH